MHLKVHDFFIWECWWWNYLKGMCEATRLREAMNETTELKVGDFSTFFDPLVQNRTHWTHRVPNLQHAIFKTRQHAFRRVHAHTNRPRNRNAKIFQKFASWPYQHHSSSLSSINSSHSALPSFQYTHREKNRDFLFLSFPSFLGSVGPTKIVYPARKWVLGPV